MRGWARDLVMGGRFAVAGGRQGWVRTILTAVGVAFAVTVMLLAASLPNLLHERDARADARTQGPGTASVDGPKRSDTSLLMDSASTTFHGQAIVGKSLQAEGSSPKLPPGVDKLPGPGEMVVSPALKKLLESPEAKELDRRLDGRVVGTIGQDGLLKPTELVFYMGSDTLGGAGSTAQRLDGFGGAMEDEPLPPVALLLVVVACVVLLLPVGAFVATAARFGGEQRDQRLAALRLVGADTAMAHRMAAGESLVGALFGLVLGSGLFLAGRALIGRVAVGEISVFPSDVSPSPGIVTLIALGVPVMVVASALLAMRGIAVEPLGVVRQAAPRGRRLWWRLLAPVAGLALLYPLAGSAAGKEGGVDKTQTAAGIILLLSGVALLLPWAVERLVGAMRGGPLSWQLATRRLQLSGSSSTRAISGITIAVAGAIALQMFFAGASSASGASTGDQPSRNRLNVAAFTATGDQRGAEDLERRLARTKGVRDSIGYLESYEELAGKGETYASVIVADCATLKKLARIGPCADGQVFRGKSKHKEADSVLPKPGEKLRFASDEQSSGPGSGAGSEAKGKDSHGDGWTVPADARTVESRTHWWEGPGNALLLTPSALALDRLDNPTFTGWVRTDPGEPEAGEYVNTTVFHFDPAYSVLTEGEEQAEDTMAALGRAIVAGAAVIMGLIGASMVVSTVEQLRSSRRQLAVLVAFGTPRSALGASVLWQTAVPVALGLTMAAGFGTLLGWVLLRLVREPVTDWLAFLPMVGIGAGVVALATLGTLPVLWRLMRPEGLRTE
ncbi:FtsX-like permease family protein [Streptomyces iconiensis]|uniref:ABC transporter permease n=1 Tax=Streptomyces iconiensis TaxID=1384038 RepID=A0ABT7A3X0_9ACTN|nr:ABC transporter permease [Streptomyces iconiensis]MDJ1136025.1 ABC transporter permease [Streptomyces iconiensis]